MLTPKRCFEQFGRQGKRSNSIITSTNTDAHQCRRSLGDEIKREKLGLTVDNVFHLLKNTEHCKGNENFVSEETVLSFCSIAGVYFARGRGGGSLRISGWGCVARTLESYTRASFSWMLLPYTRVNSWFP